MSPQEMIARYANDVARRLPYEMRADVSAELEALLIDELTAKVDVGASGIEATRTLLANFGAPAEVALNYHTPASVIDLRDARLFGKIATVILTALVVLAFSVALSEPTAATDPTIPASVAGETTKLGLQILGAMLVVFWAIGAVRHRWPQRAWSPRSLPPVRNQDAVNRPLTLLAVFFWSAGLAILAVGPASVIALIVGEAAPAPLLKAFTYDSAFVAERARYLWVTLAVAIAIVAWQAMTGRRTRASRIVNAVSSLVLAAVMLHVVLAGGIFAAEPANQYMKLAMALFGGWALVESIATLVRETRNSNLGSGSTASA